MAFRTIAASALLITILVNIGAMAADWQAVERSGSKGNEKIAIDRSRIGYGSAGMVAVWSRLDMPQPVSDAEGKYNAVEALNRYDCAGNGGANSFVTLKRLYLLDNTLIRVERVSVPKDMGIVAGSVDAAIAADVCKTAAGKLQSADASRSGVGGLMNADAQKSVDVTSPSRIVAVADAGHSAAVAPATPAIAPRRFINLPHIDPSQIQRPTDAPKPAPASKADSSRKEPPKSKAAAIKSEAAKAGVSLGPQPSGLDRHSREMALATSGSKRRETGLRLPASGDVPAEIHQHKDIHWGYEGDGAPARWSRLSGDYGLCDSGRRQSPIDIHEGIRVDLESIKFDYRPSQFRIIDTGHTVQVGLDEGNSLSVMGRTYRLVQLHFHRPSEERIDGRGFEMVMHLVHKDDEGRLAVVAVLLERGEEQSVIQTFWNHLPLQTDLELTPATAIDPNKLLPEARTYYTYMGSLTTPPCSEGVLWMVMKQPLQVSAEQIAIFSRLYKNNARPIQPSNGRLVKENR